MMRQPSLSLYHIEMILLPKTVDAVKRKLATHGLHLKTHVDALSYVLQTIEGFLLPGDRHVGNAYLTTAMRISLHDRLILPFAYEGVLFVLEAVFCSHCYMKHRSLDICSHGLSVSLCPITEHKQFVPTDFVGPLLNFAIPRVAGPGYGIIYYGMLETAFPVFPGASGNLANLIPIMKKYGCTAEDLRLEKEAIEAKALELATTHCCKVNAQIEKYCNEIMGMNCGSARVAPVEQDEHTADHVQTSVDVGTVHVETRLAV